MNRLGMREVSRKGFLGGRNSRCRGLGGGVVGCIVGIKGGLLW